MSMAALKWCRGVRGLTFSQKAVLMILCDHANEDQLAWPSQALIADELCTSDRTVRRSLVALVECGHVSRVVADHSRAVRYRVELSPDSVSVQGEIDPDSVSVHPDSVSVKPDSVSVHPDTVSDRSISKRKKPKRSQKPKARAGLPDGFPVDACLGGFGSGYGSDPGAWLPDCTACVVEHHGTDHEVTPQAVEAVAAWLRTWPSNDGTMTIQTPLRKTKWANYLEQARKWHKMGRPERKQQPHRKPIDNTPTPYKD